MSTSVGDRILGRTEAVLQMVRDHVQAIREDRQNTQEIIGQLRRALSIMGEFADAVDRVERIIKRYEHTEIVSSEELAKELSVHPATVRRLYRQGVIPGYRITDRGMIRFDKAEAIAAIKHGRSRKNT